MIEPVKCPTGYALDDPESTYTCAKCESHRDSAGGSSPCNQVSLG